jgi:hypothetical protein
MEASLRRQRVLAILFCGLVLLMFAERRLAELQFDSSHIVRLENNERADGDEIYNRLIFVDDAAEVRVPGISDACHAALIPLDSNLLALTIVRLSESRAPPYSLSLSV